MPVIAAVTLLLLLFLPVSGSWPQGPRSGAKAADADDTKNKLNTRLVNVNVKVTDRSGRPVADLKRDDFVILEDNTPRDIAYFEPVDAPLNLILLLDLSGSMGSRLQLIRSAAGRFVDSLGRDDRIAVAFFTTRFHLACDFTSDRELLKKRVAQLADPGSNNTSFDSTWSALDMLSRLNKTRKAIVVMTDGVESPFIFGEEGSPKRSADLMLRLGQDDAPFFPIYFDAERESGGRYKPKAFGNARRQLRALAEDSGGVYFAAGPEEIDGIYQRVAAELHLLYSLAYTMTDAPNYGRWRKIAVKVNIPGAIPRTRSGYYAR